MTAGRSTEVMPLAEVEAFYTGPSSETKSIG